jgi:hypothetical protein
MTTFNQGEWVVLANEVQEIEILRQYSTKKKPPFPWFVLSGGEFLRFDNNLAYYANRFKKAPPPNKDLEDYL